MFKDFPRSLFVIMTNMNLSLAGCVILDKDQRIFLLHRNKNGLHQWELPGGKVEPNEDIRQTAVRELEEEMGIMVNLVKRLGEAHFEENRTDHLSTWFLAVIVAGEMSICEPETFDDFKSFSLHELSELKLSNNMIKLREAILTGKVELT